MKRVVVFGVGYMFEMLSKKGAFRNCEIIVYSDNNSSMWGKRIGEKEIVQPSRIKEFEFDEILITTSKYEKEIRLQLMDVYGIDSDMIRLAEPNKYGAELYFWDNKFKKGGNSFRNGYYKDLMLQIAEEQDDLFLKDKTIADFGCGPQGSLHWIETPCVKLGIDVLADSYMEEFGAALIKHKMIYVKSSERYIPIGDEVVDCLFTINSLDHVDNLEDMCNEIVRIIKPGGMLYGSFNLNEPYSYCEPQTLTYEKLESILLKYFEVESKKFAYKGKERTYENFEAGNIFKNPQDDEEMIVWIKARKKM